MAGIRPAVDPYVREPAFFPEGEPVGLGTAVDVVKVLVAPTYSTTIFWTSIVASFAGGPPVQPGLASVLGFISYCICKDSGGEAYQWAIITCTGSVGMFLSKTMTSSPSNR